MKRKQNIIDFQKELDIQQITQILRNCEVSFCSALLSEIVDLLVEQPFLQISGHDRNGHR